MARALANAGSGLPKTREIDGWSPSVANAVDRLGWERRSRGQEDLRRLSPSTGRARSHRSIPITDPIRPIEFKPIGFKPIGFKPVGFKTKQNAPRLRPRRLELGEDARRDGVHGAEGVAVVGPFHAQDLANERSAERE